MKGEIVSILKSLFLEKTNYCFNHPENIAVSFCYNCKRYFCKDCINEGPRHYYCNSLSCMELYYQELDYANNPRFCPKCLSETTDESSGDIISVNLIGDKFINKNSEICSLCGSIIFEKIGPIFGRKGKFKVIWLNDNHTKFISRKMKIT